MFKWIKESLFGAGRGYEEGSTVLPKVYDIPPMPKVKPCKGSDISEPVISFVECVRKNTKRFDVAVDTSWSYPRTSDNNCYKIWDKLLAKGWYIREDNWLGNVYFIISYDGSKCHTEAFFLTSDEKEYLTKEISSIMNYRVDRKAKLDKIRADRRIRDTRNKLKELYK